MNTIGKRKLNTLCWIFQHIALKMEGVVLVYYDSDVVSTSKGVLFKCPNGLKFIKISEEMSLATLREAIIDVTRGGRSLFEVFFYHKHVYLGNDCVEYDYMELKDDNEAGKMFFIFSHFSSKSPIKLYAMVGRSPEEIFVMLRKSGPTEEIIVLMHGSMTKTSSNKDHNFI